MTGGLFIVDASVVIAWLSQETSSAAARDLFSFQLSFAAPDIILAETANALHRKQRRGLMSAAAARSAVDTASNTFVKYFASVELIEDALKLSQSLDHSVCDCLYVVASRRSSAPLITLDASFIEKLASTPDSSRIVHLKHWSPP